MNILMIIERPDRSFITEETTLEALKQGIVFGDVYFKAEQRNTDGLLEYAVAFTPIVDLPIRNIRIRFALDDWSDETYFYDNSTCTNAFACINKIEAMAGDSREILLVLDKQNNTKLNLAFTSHEKFFTYFKFNERKVDVVFSLESKVVEKGQTMVLETVAVDTALDGFDFFNKYVDILQKRYMRLPLKKAPSGWSSWSCKYNVIDEEDIYDQVCLLKERYGLRAPLIQIDDGWQKQSTFAAHWTKADSFPSGIPAISQKIRDLGMNFGLWYAPGLVHEFSEAFEDFRPMLNIEPGQTEPRHSMGDEKDGRVYDMDISDPKVVEYIKGIFKQGVEEYGCSYFKIDFLIFLLLRWRDDDNIIYKNGYKVEVYNNMVKAIREAVGDDVFLLACGAPIAESVGVFDGMRVAADITQGLKTRDNAWDLIRKCSQNTFLRSPFSGKVLVLDPDAVVLRNYQAKNVEDGLSMTYPEAKTWATVVAMSGGHALLNEDMKLLSDDRKDLFDKIIPPYGKASTPVDFFEYPNCTQSYIDVENKSVKTRLVGIYNWSEEVKDFSIDLGDMGKCIVMDAWTNEVYGIFEGKVPVERLAPHASMMFNIKAIADRPFFLYSDDTVHHGAGSVTDSYANGTFTVETNFAKDANAYIYVPAGCEYQGEFVKKLENGASVYKYTK